jgi:hypothetical protein
LIWRNVVAISWVLCVCVTLALFFSHGHGEDIIFLPGCPGIRLHVH